MQELLKHLAESLADGSFIALTLSRPACGDAPEVPRRITARPVTLRAGERLQWTLTFDRRETHENLTSDESHQRVAQLLGETFRQANLFTERVDAFARVDKSGRWWVDTSPPSKSRRPQQVHDRPKSYLLQEGTPCRFLDALGVMTADGCVRQAKQHKFRQINRFLELVNDVLPHLPKEGPLVVVDYGCGLSYLTFALYHLLTVIHGRGVQMIAVDANPEVIARCEALRQELDLAGLAFQVSAIDEVHSPPKIHLAVSLHACDTATDDALAHAIERESDVILAAPCCQHELAGRISGESLSLLTRHGILKERLASLATDALRAALLEAAGYRTQVIEFIDTEHTPKNLLLRAVRRERPASDGGRRQRVEELKSLLGIREQRLETQLRLRGLLPD